LLCFFKTINQFGQKYFTIFASVSKMRRKSKLRWSGK
jgi:hypothetical protein